MTQEDKKLLLVDICARLPYGVKLGFKDSVLILEPEQYDVFTRQLFTNQVYPESDAVIKLGYEIQNYSPYLRPMSSMTEEEEEEYKDYLRSIEGQLIGFQGRVIWVIDWLNAHHFDYRGLIDKGLALEASKNMYKI